MSAMPNETTLHRYISTERDAGNLGLSLSLIHISEPTRPY